MAKLMEHLLTNVAGLYNGAGHVNDYVQSYTEYMGARMATFLHTQVATVSNWTLVLVIFLVNTGLVYLCDRMNALYQARTQQPACVDAGADEGFVECDEATLARANVQPGDTTTTTVEVLERDPTDGRYRFVPVTLSARFSRKLVACKNSLCSLWRMAFVDKASETTVQRQLDAMQEDLDVTSTRNLASMPDAGISDSFLDMLQQTNTAQCRRYGNTLPGFMAVKIKCAEKDKEERAGQNVEPGSEDQEKVADGQAATGDEKPKQTKPEETTGNKEKVNATGLEDEPKKNVKETREKIALKSKCEGSLAPATNTECKATA